MELKILEEVGGKERVKDGRGRSSRGRREIRECRKGR
jgi:hypothetical protein